MRPHPTKGVRHYPETKRDRFLTDIEIRAVWDYLSTHERVVSATAVMLILLTGARPQEAYAAKWADVNLKAALWTKPASTTKQRKTHIVHLSPAAVDALEVAAQAHGQDVAVSIPLACGPEQACERWQDVLVLTA